MPATAYVDIFATKGIEYLLVIGFLLALILYWRLLGRASAVRAPAPVPVAWFRLSDDVLYHQGHTWVLPRGSETVRVGIDDFAQRLLGRPDAVESPRVGDRVVQGEEGLRLRFGPSSVDLLSPVEGQVVAVNEDVTAAPRLVNDDPYGKGWLFEVRVPRLKANLRSLLSGELARSWMEGTVAALRRRMAGELGPVLQDGGAPVSGIARDLSPDRWEEVAREFLLTE